jgi:general secretion pathway protein E|tara:strand:- start:5957 stop:7351 length:1395 start_codon:yes stop_codon:yes gene_type:complete
MILNEKKLRKLGIKINNEKNPLEVTIQNNLTRPTKHDLWLAFGDKVKLKLDENNFSESTPNNNNRDNEIFSEVDEYISEIDFIKTAEIALSANDENDAPIVRLFNTLLSAAISRDASDLHIDPNEKNLLVRMRIDGVMTDFTELDRRVAQMIISRIKLVCNLDITEKRLPQDGRMNVFFKGNSIDIRVATLPTKNGERIVLRFFTSYLTHAKIEETALKPLHINSLMNVISKQSGLILVCGPTGSGKTTTIYSLLNTLLGRGLNIMTIEDPIEVELPKIIQSQVNENVGLTFAAGLKSLLRNDPDVILVGEIRDPDTAEIAVRAAMTGHLVISTVHANSPVGAIKRLTNLNVDPSLLSDCLLGVYSQRLVRIYCNECRKESITSESHSSNLPVIFPGCKKCYNSGFKGRSPIMSHVEINDEIASLIEKNPAKIIISDTMYEEALDLHESGSTPKFEIARLKQII